MQKMSAEGSEVRDDIASLNDLPDFNFEMIHRKTVIEPKKVNKISMAYTDVEGHEPSYGTNR